MTSKHTTTPEDLNKVYEPNNIGLKGILSFGVGLLLLIVITFVLMAVFVYYLDQHSIESAGPPNPMAMSDKERLPPEPRLQLAPGFGVDSPDGRVNLELSIPSSEYKEVRKEWDAIIANGEKDPKTGTVLALPIEEAKTKFLESNPKAATGPAAEKLLKDAHMFVSDASAGRLAGETRR